MEKIVPVNLVSHLFFNQPHIGFTLCKDIPHLFFCGQHPPPPVNVLHSVNLHIYSQSGSGPAFMLL